jgi:hypothetical protein
VTFFAVYALSQSASSEWIFNNRSNIASGQIPARTVTAYHGGTSDILVMKDSQPFLLNSKVAPVAVSAESRIPMYFPSTATSMQAVSAAQALLLRHAA